MDFKGLFNDITFDLHISPILEKEQEFSLFYL